MDPEFHEGVEPGDVRKFVKDVFGEDIHPKRVTSIAKATTGVPATGSLAISATGIGFAHVCGASPKHAVKQVDRLAGNGKVDVWEYFRYRVPHVVSERQAIVVAMGWTGVDRDGHTAIALNLLTDHGRALPLGWRTVRKSALKDNRNEYEDSVLTRLYEMLPIGVSVTIVAGRGFMDTALFEAFRDCLAFRYIIRLRGNGKMRAANSERRTAAQWIDKGGRAKTLRQPA